MAEGRFYITDSNLFDYFDFTPEVSAMQITRNDDYENVTHELDIKGSGDTDVLIFLNKEMIENLVIYLNSELKVLEEKKNG